MFESLPMSVFASIVGLLLAWSSAAKPYPPEDSVTGLDSYVERPSIQLVKNSDQWLAAWNRHRGITPIGNTDVLKYPSVDFPPKVDFEQNVVVVIFGGLASNGGYRVEDSVKTSQAIVVRLMPLPLPGSGTNSAFKANPYLFLQYKKTKLPFRIQLSSTAEDGTIQWRTIAELASKEEKSSG